MEYTPHFGFYFDPIRICLLSSWPHEALHYNIFLEVNYWIQCTLHVSRSDWLIRTIHSPMGFTLSLVCLFTLYLGSFFECLENRDLENGDNRQQTWKTQTSKTKHRSWKGSKHCLWEVSFLTKSIGESNLKRAQNYHRDAFKFIDKLSLPETSNLTDADVADSFDCTSNSRLQHIKYKRRWNFIKLDIRTHKN